MNLIGQFVLVGSPSIKEENFAINFHKSFSIESKHA